MMIIKMIDTEEEYQRSLERLDVLMDAAPGSPQEAELDLLSYLVDKYEQEHFPIELPDPVEAIKFRMQQQGLTRKDLIPYIGSQSKVSEVLNRKRPLSLSMMRALHAGLGIPAEVLLQEPGRQLGEARYNPADYPLKEMVQAGYFPGVDTLRKFKERAEELLQDFFALLERVEPQEMICRNTHAKTKSGLVVASGHENYQVADRSSPVPDENHGEARAYEMDKNALRAWQTRALWLCAQQKLPPYKQGVVTEGFIRRVINLSAFPKGPLMAEQALIGCGIHFVILPHLPRTYLDGASFKAPDGRPVIGITLRYDRLDNFWFTLAHELAHVLLHLGKHNIAFFDDIEHGPQFSGNQQEDEANQLSARLLIPHEAWEACKETLIATLDEHRVVELAQDLDISPAIVAGRVRWEIDNYAIFSDLLGSGNLKKMFAKG